MLTNFILGRRFHHKALRIIYLQNN